MTEQTPYPTVALRHHAPIAPPPGPSTELINVSVGPAGEVVAVWASPEARAASCARLTAPNGVRYSPTVLDPPVTVHVTTYDPDPVQTVAITDLTVPNPHVQPLPGGRILLVSPRCRWYGDSAGHDADHRADRNAVSYHSDGTRAGEGVLGDGIGRLATTAAGRIWAGYYDEGIYGNFGWGGPDGPRPIGAPGLVGFDEDFARVWPSAEDRFGLGDDCSCLNVAGDTLWAGYSGGVVAVRDGVRTTWRSDDGGRGYGLLVDEPAGRIALFSALGRGRDERLRVGDLDDYAGEITWQQPRSLLLPDGSALPPSYVHGRGATMHVVTGTDWYRLDLADLD